MYGLLVCTSLIYALSTGSLIAQSGADSKANANILTTVRIVVPVTAGETTLPAGTYELRLTGERPAPPVGQAQNAQEWVEFIKGGTVIAREAAEILYDDDLPSEGASSQKARPGTRVEILKGGEFLRISVKREHDRYLIYLPVKREESGG
jgi:hypothetical protein